MKLKVYFVHLFIRYGLTSLVSKILKLYIKKKDI
jgi:hypothetical protein